MTALSTINLKYMISTITVTIYYMYLARQTLSMEGCYVNTTVAALSWNVKNVFRYELYLDV